jgi:hypothetical protein
MAVILSNSSLRNRKNNYINPAVTELEVIGLAIDTNIQLMKLKEDLYQGTLEIHKRIEALDKRITMLEMEKKTDVQNHVSALERRVQILEKSLGEREK